MTAQTARRADYRARDDARTDALVAHREAVEGRGTVLTFRVPNRRVRIRPTGRCPWCGSSCFEVRWPNVDTESHHASYRGSIVCLPCGRRCADLVVGGD